MKDYAVIHSLLNGTAKMNDAVEKKWLSGSKKLSRAQPGLDETLYVRSLKNVLKGYHFVECTDIITFLNLFCSAGIEKNELFYTEMKIKQCIDTHDNGSDYFSELRAAYKSITDMKHAYTKNFCDRED
ncbi:hypothetical protein [Pantoea ananatis]|nr:hypothetical protein [Pantoea ananatis]UYL01548.1 hypothetical protein NG830_20505 [Pantoea ananatis]